MNRITAIKATAVTVPHKKKGALLVGSETSVGNTPSERTHGNNNNPSFDQRLDFSASVSSRDYMKIPLEEAFTPKVYVDSQNEVGISTFDSKNTENTPTHKRLFVRHGSNEHINTIEEQEEETKNQESPGLRAVTPLQKTVSFASPSSGFDLEAQPARNFNTAIEFTSVHPVQLSRQATNPQSNQVPDQSGVEVISVPENNLDPVAAHTNSASNNNNARTAQNNRLNELNARIEIYVYRKVALSIRTNLIFAATVVVLYLLALLVFQKVFSWQVPFGIFWFICFVRSFLALRKKNISRMTDKHKRAKYFEVLEWALFASFLVVSALKLENISVILFPFGLVGFLGSLVFPLWYDTCRSYYKKRTLVTAKIISWAHILLLCLKIDDIIHTWSYVVYPLLFVTFFFVAVSLGYALVSVCYFIKNYNTPHFRIFMLGHLWELFLSLFSWPLAFSVFGLLQTLEKNKESILSITLPVGLGYAIGFIVYTLVIQKTLMRFLMGPMIAAARERLDKVKDKQQFESIEENDGYLIKLSTTYFVEMPHGFKLKDKQQIEAWKEKIKEAKLNGKPGQADTKRPNTHKILPDDDKDMVVMDVEPHSADKWKRDRQKLDVKVGIPRPLKPIVPDETTKPIMMDSAKGDANNAIKVSYSMDDIDIMDQVQRPADQKEADDNDKQCIVCFSTAPNAVIMSCGHGGVCYPCAIEAWKKDDNCLLCRNPISKVLKVNVLNGVDVAKVMVSTTKKPLLF